jgi:hypothetical protein
MVKYSLGFVEMLRSLSMVARTLSIVRGFPTPMTLASLLACVVMIMESALHASCNCGLAQVCEVS